MANIIKEAGELIGNIVCGLAFGNGYAYQDKLEEFNKENLEYEKLSKPLHTSFSKESVLVENKYRQSNWKSLETCRYCESGTKYDTADKTVVGCGVLKKALVNAMHNGTVSNLANINPTEFAKVDLYGTCAKFEFERQK